MCTDHQISTLSIPELLKLTTSIKRLLRNRAIIRNENNPVIGELAERIACRALALTPVPESGAGHIAADSQGVRYQIKARKLTPRNHSQRLGALRNLNDKKHFKMLVAIVFEPDFSITRAVLIDRDVVQHYASHSHHQNGEVLNLNRIPSNEMSDIRDKIIQAFNTL